LGFVGVGGRGWNNLEELSHQNVVALCDVDEVRAKMAFEAHPRASRYTDFRQMLEKQKDLDGVVVSTPDHTHAVIAAMAMRLGKHVYCEKPLAYSIHECRVLRDAAEKNKVVTQMGNHKTAALGFRKVVEVIQDGALGAVREGYVWTNRPVWPQGMKYPTDEQTVPNTLNWDLWLGPAAARRYHSDYAPFKWRGWVEFGTGTIGDMACHNVNLPYLALNLGLPEVVEPESSSQVRDSYPNWAILRFSFPARGPLPPVKLFWYDGGKQPPAALVTEKRILPPNAAIAKRGIILVGDKGTLYSQGDYGEQAFLIVDGHMKEIQGLPERLSVPPSHHEEWLAACRGGPAPLSNFAQASVFSEAMLLGNVALRAGTRIEWDPAKMEVRNVPKANQFVSRAYREGWTL
jgi:predicted dehydrogenase